MFRKYMPSLTAKVIRTSNASSLFQELLQSILFLSIKKLSKKHEIIQLKKEKTLM